MLQSCLGERKYPTYTLWQVALTYSDGSQTLLGTDASSWLALNADPVFDPSCCTSDPSWFFQPAENFDARLEPVGWREPGFIANDPRWVRAAETSGWGDVPLEARKTRPMAITEGIVPASIVVLGPGHIFIDLGREIQGGLHVNFPSTAVAGTQVWGDIVCLPYYKSDNVVSDSLQIVVRLGEELISEDPPAVMYNMRTGNKYVHTVREMKRL